MAEKKGKVLCVDDEPNILRSLQWLLQKEFEVVTAPTGADGLALVQQNSFDVVISDQRMPGMSGSEFLREVRKVSPRALRILLTGYSDLQAILRSVNEGEVFRFINKPWNISELPRIVAEAALIAQTQPIPSTDPVVPEISHADSNAEAILVLDDDPATMSLMQESIGAGTRVSHARNLADAVDTLNTQNIGVIVSDTRVGSVDTTRLLKMLKQQRPDIVSVVLSADTDATDIIGLINQGQIYRFVPKPVKSAFLKIVLVSALGKHRQLKADPSTAKRHIVEQVAAEAEKSLLQDVHSAVKQSGRGELAASGGLLQRVTSGFKRLFG